MLARLLFIMIILSYEICSEGFNTQLLNSRLVPFTKTKVRLIGTDFYDDNDNWKNNREKKYNFDADSYFINNEEVENYEIIYTLIWFDCDDCKELLSDVKKNGIKILYINGSYYFFDEDDEDHETNSPIFYKNNELIATDLFSIYEKLFLIKK
jgi:hypothetical protein